MEYKSNNGENSQQYTLAFDAYSRTLQTRCRTNRRLSGDQLLIKRHILDVTPGEASVLGAMPDEAVFGISCKDISCRFT